VKKQVRKEWEGEFPREEAVEKSLSFLFVILADIPGYKTL